MYSFFIHYLLGRLILPVLRITVVILIIALLVTPVMAQDEPPALPPGDSLPPDTVIPVEDAWFILATGLIAILSVMLKAPITTIAVSWLKRIPLFSGVSSAVLAYSIAGVLTAAVWISRAAGIETQLNSILAFLTILGGASLDLVGTIIGSSGIYNYAVQVGAPGLKYQRPSKAAPMGAMFLPYSNPEEVGWKGWYELDGKTVGFRRLDGGYVPMPS